MGATVSAMEFPNRLEPFIFQTKDAQNTTVRSFTLCLSLLFNVYQKSNRWLLQVLNLCACIYFSFCVYWRTHTSACTKLSRDFLQARLNCEINACFVLNELCDLYVYCKILALKLSSLKLKKKLKKKLFGRGVTYSLKRAQNCYWRMQIMTERKQQLEERFESMSIKIV